MTMKDSQAGPEIVPVAVASAVQVNETMPSSTGNESIETPAQKTMEPVYNTSEAVMIDIADQEKQGSLCCRCCCDMRRAVIIVNIIIGVVALINLILNATGVLVDPTYIDRLDIDDDEVEDDARDIFERLAVRQAILSGITMVFCVYAIRGALCYCTPKVAMQAMWLLIAWILGIVFSIIAVQDANDVEGIKNNDDINVRYDFVGYIIGAITTGLSMYPHIAFIREVKAGIMSKETYPREKYSCCCTDV